MKTLIIDNKYIDELFKTNSKNEKIYKLIKDVIMQYDYSYVNFIYNIFLLYNNIYINNKYNRLSYIEIQDIVNKLSNYKKDIIVDHIVVSDIYDIVYTLYSTEYQFNDLLYEDIFNKLTNMCSYIDIDIDEIFEDILETLTNVFIVINTNIFNYIFSKDKEFDNNVVIYLEIVNNYLLLNIIV